VSIQELQHLALRNGIGGIRQHFHDPHAAHGHHDLESSGVQKVPHEHARRVAELGIGRLAAAPQFGFVDDVVMQERGRMNEFHDGCEFHMMLAAIAGRPGGKENERRAQALAASSDDVLRDLAHEHYVGLEPTPDHGIHRKHVCGDEVAKECGLQRGDYRTAEST